MKTQKKPQIIPINWANKEGVWLSPKGAAQYFRNGRGIAYGTLMNNLRAGKLRDISIRDAYGWMVLVPQMWIDNYNAQRGKVVPFGNEKKQMQIA